MKLYLCVLFINLFSIEVFACEQHKRCSDCIRDVSQCIWCAADNYEGLRCKQKTFIPSDWCSGQTIDPESTREPTPDSQFSSNKTNIVQIKPLKTKINLRPGQSLDFEFAYKRVKDYPLDIYFLLDGSLSMKRVQADTAQQSKNIYEMLRIMTEDVYLGMGSFVDKNALPYTDTINSDKTFSFKNRLRLTANYEEFKKVLSDTEFGENFDEPEGVFDALAQVMTCKDEIGWRNQSRKIIVVITDATYHMAGDGKWAGIDQPYDGKCHTENSTYTKELDMDYPSISILKKLALQEEIVTIYAVSQTVLDVYTPLNNSFTYVASYDEKEIKTILESKYNEIEEHINLKHNINPDYRKYFSLSFKPNCNIKKCKVNINEQINITGSIKVIEYFDADNILVDIMVEGLKEKLTLDVNIIRECDCKSEINSPSCSKSGTRRCGVCECDSERSGPSCECSKSSKSNYDNKATCIAPNSTEVCSGIGDCYCGACICRDSFKGQYCECNTQRCPRDTNRALCSNNGECGKIECGKCDCYDDWTGDDCSCSLLQTNCKDDESKVCNDCGTCECNVCKCDSFADWDARITHDPYCKPINSKQVQSRQCIHLHPCVLDYIKHDNSSCKQIDISSVDNLNDLNDTADWTICPDLRADVGCYTKFMYRYKEDDYGIEVVAQTALNCAETYYMVGGGCLATVIIIGAVTLIAWKIITTRKDRAEYERFYKELHDGTVIETENTTYIPATASFNNPAFRRTSCN